jgi:hypothetical protein
MWNRQQSANPPVPGIVIRQSFGPEVFTAAGTNQENREPMADNPLAPDPKRDQRIRERAYHLWEQEGRPHGRDQEFWERARELIGMEDNPHAGELPNPMNHSDSPRETGIEEAEIQANLGEFPDRFADQGEVQQTPAAVHSPRRPKPAESPAAPPTRTAPTGVKKAAAPRKAPPKGRKP